MWYPQFSFFFFSVSNSKHLDESARAGDQPELGSCLSCELRGYRISAALKGHTKLKLRGDRNYAAQRAEGAHEPAAVSFRRTLLSHPIAPTLDALAGFELTPVVRSSAHIISLPA